MMDRIICLGKRYWVHLSLLCISVGAFCLRVIPAHPKVVSDTGIKFALSDAYYHMRLIDNLATNFPNFSYYDPYFVYPGTTVIGGVHFFDWLVASVAWVIGLGNPSLSLVSTVGIYTPPVLAALTAVPVFFIGKAVFNKYAGLVAAALLVITPGEFLGRSLLGSTDHHVAEVLLSTTAVALFIYALKTETFGKRLLLSSLTGLALGTYMLTWTGGLLFVLIIGLYTVIQVVVDHYRKVSSYGLTITVSVAFLVATVMNYSRLLPDEILLSLVVATATPSVLFTLSVLLSCYNWKPILLPVIIVAVSVTGLVSLNLLYPGFLNYLSAFIPTGATATTTMELQPMLFPQGYFTMNLVWSNFTVSVFFVPVALVILLVSLVKSKGEDSAKTLLVVWSVVMVLLAINQRRYAYYALVVTSLLTAYLSCLLVRVSVRTIKPRRTQRRGKVYVERKEHFLAVLVAMALVWVFVPINVSASVRSASAVPFVPSDAWQSSLLWLRDNTPEPFGGDDLYNTYLPLLEKDLPEGQPDHGFVTVRGKQYLKSPEPDYAVTSWWDYGYWITRTGHRVPNANPAQNKDAITRVAEFFMSEGDDYREMVDELRSGYVIIDQAMVTIKLHAMATWSGGNQSDYFGTYYVQQNGVYQPVVLFYPEYYETLAVRLYAFSDGSGDREQTLVVEYTDDKVVTSAVAVETYEEALAMVDASQSPNVRIVSAAPFLSPIPLPAMDEYEMVYASTGMLNGQPEVKIFEYVGSAE